MQFRDHEAEREGYVWQLWLRHADEPHKPFTYHDSYQTQADAIDAGKSWSGCEHEVRPSPSARSLPIPTPGSKTGPALKSKALRGDRTTAALVVSALLTGATPVCAQGWIEQPSFIIGDDHTLLRSNPTDRAACVATLGIRDGKPTIDLGKDCVLDDGSLHGKPGAALVFKRAP